MNRNFIIAFLILLGVVVGVYFFRQNTMKPPEQTTVAAETKVSPTSTEKAVLVIYKGKLPCADCEGIDTRLTFYKDETYAMSSTYIGKNTEPFVEKGKWTYVRGDATNPDAVVYQLYDQEGTQSNEENYLEQGDKIIPLDKDMKPIDSPFDMSLTKEATE